MATSNVDLELKKVICLVIYVTMVFYCYIGVGDIMVFWADPLHEL